MADDAPKHDAMNDVYMFLGFMAILVALWYFAGGPGKADLKGLFLAPPAPLGNGEAYGPTLGSTTEETAATSAASTSASGNSGFYLQQ